MRIAYFINQYPKVSHSFIRREILALERRGIEIERIALRGWDAELVDAEDKQEREKTRYVLKRGLAALVSVTLASLFLRPLKWLSALGLALKMASKSTRRIPLHNLIYFMEACVVARWMSESDADHLHAHFGTNSADVAMLASIISGKTYSVTVHGADEFDKPEAIGLAEKARRSAFTVAISSFGRSQIYRWLDPSDWGKIKVAHCGLEPAFHQIEATPFPRHPRFVYVGRLDKGKGISLILQATQLLLNKGMQFEVVIAGGGELKERFDKEIASLGLAGKVQITGWISSDGVREQLLASTALVLPSFAEGLPVVIMEAMALRRPILASYMAGIPELVQSGETGWLFPAGSVEELASAMQACLETPASQLTSMGERARQRVLERHDIDREAAKIAGYFHEAIQNRTPVLSRDARWQQSN